MKLLVTTLFILLILKGVCQSKEFENSFFETTPQYEDSVIILNWTNLIMGLEMSSVRFQTLVQSCHYKYSEAENSYFANTSAPSGHYTVNKKTDEFQMTWTNNKNYSSFLKNQMQNCLSPLNDWTVFKNQFRTLNLGNYEYKT